MRKLILAGMTAVLLAGTGFAYAATSTGAADSTQLAAADTPPPPPPGGPDDQGGPPGPRGPGHHGPRGDGPPPPPPAEKAAHFRIERGPLSIDVKCAEADTTQACAAIALQLIDKAAALPAQ